MSLVNFSACLARRYAAAYEAKPIQTAVTSGVVIKTGAAAAAASPGSPPAPTSISKAQLAEFLKESFELEVDIDEVLGGPGSTIDVASFEALCLKKD